MMFSIVKKGALFALENKKQSESIEKTEKSTKFATLLRVRH